MCIFVLAILFCSQFLHFGVHIFVRMRQVHPFPEGNTRTTAVFCIKYLRYLGYNVNNVPFARHSRYFRNALVRANYTNAPAGVGVDYSFLIKFFRNLLFDETHVLKSRYLHIYCKRKELEIGQATGQVAVQVTGEVAGQVQLPGENICRLVRTLGSGQMSVRELMMGMGLKGRDNFLNKYLTPALEGGYLCLLYPDSPRHPKQKYRLTPRGCLVWDKLHS